MNETPPEAADLARPASHGPRAPEETTQVLLSLLSHELRTPLNAILGYGDLLESGITGPLTSGQTEQVGRIRASARRLLHLIEDILCLSEMETGRVDLSLDIVDAADVVAEAMELVAMDARRKDLDIRVEGPEDGVRLPADRVQLTRVLGNLLSHAVRSTDVGMVVLSFEAEGGFACFHVRDTGPGIPEDRRPSLFEPLRWADREDGRELEAGLGLYVSSRLTRLMGGDLTLESEEGEGSVVTVRFPLRAQPDE